MAKSSKTQKSSKASQNIDVRYSRLMRGSNVQLRKIAGVSGTRYSRKSLAGRILAKEYGKTVAAKFMGGK